MVLLKQEAIMSVFKRGGKGPYYIQFTYRGKTHVKSSRTENKAKALKMEKEWKDKIHSMQELGERPDITIRDALLACADSKIEKHTRDYYHANANVIIRESFASIKICDMKQWHIVKFRDSRLQEGKSPQTVKHNINVLKGAHKWAKENGYNVPPIEFPSIKVKNSRLRYLSIEEESRLLKELDPKRLRKYRPLPENRNEEEARVVQDNYDLVVVLLDTGARYSEIAELKWESVDMEGGLIRLWRSKVKNESIIYMSERVESILARRKKAASGDYVFTNRSGGPRGYQSKGIRDSFKRAGLAGFRIHDLRHTCASRLIQNGMSIYEVSKMLGHTSVQTTQRYAHLEMVDVGKKARDILNGINKC